MAQRKRKRSMFDPLEKEIRAKAKIGYTIKEVADYIYENYGPGYDYNALYPFVMRRGIKFDKPHCNGCRYHSYFIEGGGKFGVCTKHHVRLKRYDQKSTKCVEESVRNDRRRKAESYRSACEREERSDVDI